MRKRVTAGKWAGVAAMCAVAACGSDEELSRVEVQVEYPSDSAAMLTNSLHLWILVPGEEAQGATCNALVARDIGPYDRQFELLADRVFVLPDEPMPAVDDVPRGDALVYVEGVDFFGVPVLAGCVAVDIADATQSVAVSLTIAGTFDCSDPATESGSPCDDGLYCTVGETCQGGTCTGGATRDCSGEADQCSSGSCDEELGCITAPLPNGTPCNDDMYCTNGDVCTDGVCAGGPRDCSGVEDQCNDSMCDETFDTCRQVPLTGDTCDDGLFCTEPDTCSSGFCSGTTRDCSGVEDQCNNSTCNETFDRCDPVPLTGIVCDDLDMCTMDDMCDAGVCTGPVTDIDGDGYPAIGCGGGSPEDCEDDIFDVNPGATEGPMGDATCSDTLDNDCDTFVDDLDTDSCT